MRKHKLALLVVAGLLSLPLSGYTIESCTSSPAELGDPAPVVEPCPAGQACASDVLRKKPYVKNDYWWGLYTPITDNLVFKIYKHETFIAWGVNITRKSIRWIDRYAGGKEGGTCLTPLGSCEIVSGIWRVHECERVGGDTCLFRHENQGHASFTYGVAFNTWMMSCLGMRISWNIYDGYGGHRRNAWEGACAGGAASAKLSAPALTLGSGDNAVSALRYMTPKQIDSLMDACFRPGHLSRCEAEALAVYKSLPKIARRKLRPTACAALSPRALKRLHPGTLCERRANGGRGA